MAEPMQTLLNEAMKLERAALLGAAPGERTDERAGYANGSKAESMGTRTCELALRIPQVRPLPGGESLGFDPKSLARGLRSERALNLAIAEMYVQGASTRRVTEITRELCRLDVTNTDVSHAAGRAGRAAQGPRGAGLRAERRVAAAVARDLRSVFNTHDRGEADERLAKLVETHRRPAPKLTEWMETNVPDGLVAFALPEPHRRRLRTTNALERLQSRVASPHAGRDADPQRSLPPPPRLGDGRRDQRGMGSGTDRLEPGERVRTPARPVLQKKSCSTSGSVSAA